MKRLRKILQRIKLQHQILIFLLAVMTILIAVQEIYLSVMNMAGKNRQREFIDTASQQIENEIVSLTEELKDTLQSVSYNDIAERFAVTDDPGLRYTLGDDISLILDTIQISSKRMDRIFYTDFDKIIFGVKESLDFKMLDLIAQNLPDIHDGDTPVYLNLRDPDHRLLQICVCPSFQDHTTGRQFYTAAIYNIDNIKEMIAEFQSFEGVFFGTADQEGNLLAGNPKFFGEGLMGGGRQPVETLETLQIPALGWTVAGVIPAGYKGRETAMAEQFSLWITVLCTVLFALFCIIIIHNITYPIGQLSRFMECYGKSYSRERLHLKGSNEISRLSDSCNRMLDDLHDMTNRIIATQEKFYLSELAKQQSELMAMQIQINPHFLYNTLDCIRSIALACKIPEIVVISTAMAKIMRYSIKGDHEVLVREEIASIQDYLSIVQIRHQEKYEIRIEVEDSVLDFAIPKMILQPVVENAVFHGLEQKSSSRLLRIAGRACPDEKIEFLVENDGADLPVSRLSEIRESLRAVPENVFTDNGHIGLKNINSRIKLLYGEQYGLGISSREGGGVSVSLTVPMRRKPKIV